MKKIIVISTLLGYAIFLLSCGGGGSSTPSTTTIAISSCDTTDDIDSYTAMQSDDNIIQDEKPVTINRYFNDDGTQNICTVSGKAHLERG